MSMIPAPSDDHWLILSLGLIATFARVAISFVCAMILAELFYGDPGRPGPGIGIVDSYLYVLIIFALAFGLNAIQVFIHEMGHALAAWSVGRRVHLICVGIFGYAPDLKRFVTVRKPETAEYAGFVQASPVWPDLTDSKSIWISLGGPLATGGLGVLMLLSAAVLNGYVPYVVLICLGLFFVMDMVVNLIPLKWHRGSGSDGLHILQYLKGQGWTPELWAKTRLAQTYVSPVLVSDAEWAALQSLKGGPFNSTAMNTLIEKAGEQRG